VRVAFALGLTALVFAQAIHGVYTTHSESGWFLGAPRLDGWPLIAVNVFIYGYLYWLGFWFVRGTEGLERFFMAGWFAGILLWPLKMLRPQWAVIMGCNNKAHQRLRAGSRTAGGGGASVGSAGRGRPHWTELTLRRG
jgi:hypothetical protein